MAMRVVGPYAERVGDSARLTSEGRLKLEDFLTRYSGDQLIKLFRSTWRNLYVIARALQITDEEIVMLCQEGAARAFVRYDPRRAGTLTAVLWGMRHDVCKAVRDVRRCVSCWQLNDKIASPVVKRDDSAEEVSNYVARAYLSEREQTILTMCYGLGNSKRFTLVEIGIRLGLSKERVRQIRERAFEKIREVNHEV